MGVRIRCPGYLEKTWMDSTKRKDAATTTRESYGIKESKMKFEMEFGIFNDKLVIETSDFDIIKIFQEFVMFQEAYGWAVKYEAIPLEEDEDVDFSLDSEEPL